MILLKTYRKSNNLLFAEMIIALLFFVISFTVIIRVFAGADGLERDERRREQAEILAQSAAEAYSVSGNAEWAVRQALGCEAAFADGRCELSLDEGLSPAEDGEITLVLTEKRSGPAVVGCYSELSMVFMKRGEEFYSLDCSAYIPKKGEAAHFD